MNWQPVDENTPKDRIFLGWNQYMMAGKGLPSVMMWALNLSTNKYCWMGLDLAVEMHPIFWCEITSPQ